MQRKELYFKTLGILSRAYMNNTLIKGSCFACAVGNMIAANCGYKLIPSLFSGPFYWEDENNTSQKYRWTHVFVTAHKTDDNGNDLDELEQMIRPGLYIDEAKRQIDSTGYSWMELAKIEFAFESGYLVNQHNDNMFSGLMAVVEVLDTIHENTDETIIKKVTTNFKNKEEIILC